MNRPRIFYAAGPGDIVGTYESWKKGIDDPQEVSITYSSQFFELCRRRGLRGYALSYSQRRAAAKDEQLTIVHRPIPMLGSSGMLYHLGQLWSGFRMAVSAAWFGADLAVVSTGTHWFALWFMRLAGIQVVPTLHCVLWTRAHPDGMVRKLVRKLDSFFFRRGVFAAMSISDEATSQLMELAGDRPPVIEPFGPTYRPESFEEMPPPPGRSPFRVFYAGRIEVNKGVVDLLNIAVRFKNQGHAHIEFDLCGTGSMLEPLRQKAREAGLDGTFRIHGHCDRSVMRKMYELCHAVIVPTTSDFGEGFNKVVAEGVLASRPVITSSACRALNYVRDAVFEVPVDGVDQYAGAILSLAADERLYAEKVEGCRRSQGQFYDMSRNWGSALDRVVERWIQSRVNANGRAS